MTKQKKPAKATVVNLGVSFLHLKDTENTEKPIDDVMPKINPIKEGEEKSQSSWKKKKDKN